MSYWRLFCSKSQSTRLYSLLDIIQMVSSPNHSKVWLLVKVISQRPRALLKQSREHKNVYDTLTLARGCVVSNKNCWVEAGCLVVVSQRTKYSGPQWYLLQNSVCIKSAGPDLKENSLNSLPPLALARYGSEKNTLHLLAYVSRPPSFGSVSPPDQVDSSCSFEMRPICSGISREYGIVENSFIKRETHSLGVFCLMLCVAQSLAVENVEWHMMRTAVVPTL